MPEATNQAITSRENEPLPTMKAPGCEWECAAGMIGIDEKLMVYDGDCPVGTLDLLPEAERIALGNYMIGLWTRFRDNDAASIMENHDDDEDVRGDREVERSVSARYFDAETDVRDLCRAVRVLSLVLHTQLERPIDETPPILMDYGMESQNYLIDAEVLLLTVDHASALAREVVEKFG